MKLKSLIYQVLSLSYQSLLLIPIYKDLDLIRMVRISMDFKNFHMLLEVLPPLAIILILYILHPFLNRSSSILLPQNLQVVF